MVSDSEADKETISGQPSQPNDRQPTAGTHAPDLSSIPQIRHSYRTNTEDYMIDIQSSSKPSVDPHPLHSNIINVEQEFIPLIDADGDFHGVQASHVENALNNKNVDLKQPFANSADHIVADDKVGSEHVADSETKEQDNVGDEGENEKEGNDKEIKTSDDSGSKEDASVDKVDNNAKVDDATVTVNSHLEQVKYENSMRKDNAADELTQPAASGRELSSNSENDKSSVRSSSSHMTEDQHSHTVNHKPSVSSSHQKSQRDGISQSDMNVRQLQGSRIDQLPHSGRIDEDFSPQQTDVNHRGYWHPDNQPSDVRYPDEFNRYSHRSTHPVWKHVHSSFVEEFRDYWPEMQDAYRSWPELVQERQRYMNHLTDRDNFMHHQRQFINHQHQSRVRPDDGHYFQNQRTQFNRQDPNSFFDRWPGEGAEGHFGDMFHNQQHYGHNYYKQKTGIYRPSIQVDEVYRQQPASHRYVSGSDKKDDDTGPVSSVGSSEQSGGQAEFLTVDHVQRPSAEKSQSDHLSVDQGIIQSPLSAQWPSEGTAATEDLTEVKEASNIEYYEDANVLSSSQKYIDEASLPLSLLTDRKSEPISGEYSLRKLHIFTICLTHLFVFVTVWTVCIS